MNKQFLFIIFFLLLLLKGNAQNHTGDYEVKPPDVTAFNAVNIAEISEYSGKVAVSIPIFEFSIDGVKIPISIDYNSGGILVDERASRVGLGWSLQAGGMITKSIKGIDDFKFSSGSGASGGSTASDSDWYTTASGVGFDVSAPPEGYFVSQLGFLMSKFHFPSDTWVAHTGAREGEPDVYNVRVPGLNTAFVHDISRTPKEITPYGTIISTSISSISQSNANIYNWPSGIGSYDTHTINLTSNRGLVYEFNDWEQIGNREIITLPNSPPGYTKYQNHLFTHSSYPISKIFSQRTGKEVNFHYENVNLDKFENYTDRIVKRGKRNEHYNNEHRNSLWLKKIVKITFNEGTILFHYDHSRLDIPGETALTKIEIKDQNNITIKKVLFNYSYFQTTGSTSPMGKRLKLDRVLFENEKGEHLPGYNLTYNTTVLPERYSASADFSGYYNGYNWTQNPSDFPSQYFYLDPNKSILPFKIEGDNNYYEIRGTYSLRANETYAKAGVLTEIEYPTGGKNVFEHELNSFEYFGQEIKGGGLRIRRNILYDENNNVVRDVRYEYKKANGKTSGSIISLPKHATAELHNGKEDDFLGGDFIDYSNLTINNVPDKILFRVRNRSVNKLNYTKGNLVGYSRVKKIEAGNGYEIKEFSSPSSTPNTYYSPRIEANYNPWKDAMSNWMQFQVDYDFFPSLSESNEISRGNLVNHFVYSNENDLVQKTEYTFSQNKIDHIGLSETRNYPFGDENGEPYGRITVGKPFQDMKLHIERNELREVKRYDYYKGEVVVSSETNTYEPRGLLKQKLLRSSDQNIRKTNFTYPTENDSSPFIKDLFNQNRISNPIKVENFVNDIKTNELTNLYGKFNGKIEKGIVQVNKRQGGEKINEIVFNSYDSQSNPLQYKVLDNTSTVLIWGYKKTYPIAKIENASYDQISPYVNDLKLKADADNDRTKGYLGKEGALRQALNNLRTVLPNAMVTTYTYDPLIGLTSITDPKGYTSYYEYDGFNRLRLIVDADNKVIEKISYNHQGQLLNQYGNLTINITSSGLLTPGKPISFSASFSEGGGQFSYTWKVNGFEEQSNGNSTFVKTFDTEGDYNVTVLAYDSKTKRTVSKTLRISVKYPLLNIPNVSHNGSIPIFVGTPVTFTGSYAGGGSGSYNDSWWEGSAKVTSENSFIRTFTLPGIKTFRYVLVDAITGIKKEKEISVEVFSSITKPIISSKTHVVKGTTVQFTATNVSGGSGKYKYEWYVNNVKQSETWREFSYQYNSAGSYTVKVKAIDLKYNDRYQWSDPKTVYTYNPMSINATPLSGDITNNNPNVTFNITGVSGGSGSFSNVTWKIRYLQDSSQNYTSTNTSRTFSYGSNKNGEHEISATMTDTKTGEVSTVTMYVMVNRTTGGGGGNTEW